MRRSLLAGVACVALMTPSRASAQDAPAPPTPPHEHVHDAPQAGSSEQAGGGSWHLMQDGSLYLLVNHQGGPRGGNEVRAPNWWMGMAGRKAGGGDLTLIGMLSLDPAAVGTRGYREIFQVGEAYDGRPIVDRQHPHDFWMQLSAAFRRPLGSNGGVTVAGALAGEPALGPIAFMHRASAAAIPLAPLGHHTFDSTHVAFGVVTAGVDRGRFAVEASAFNGREPDQRRWNFDFGRMDSFSGRVWYRPSHAFEVQVSSGRLVEPEQLHEGNVTRTTASASYTRDGASGMTAVTVGAGMNDTGHVTRRALFGEATKGWGGTLASVRLELVEVESMLLALGDLPASHDDEERKDAVGAFTVGVQRDFGRWKGVTAAVGVNGTLYRVPEILRATHGNHPASFQIFLQVRPPAGGMGRMWNMRMAAPPMPVSNTPAEHQH